MSDNFLPNEYEVPAAAGQYTKFDEGENKIRILTSPIIGWEDWDDNRKVYRFPFNKRPPRSLSSKKDAKIKHFWAMTVWNYKLKKLQVMAITQASIQKAIKALVDNPKWGKPFEYDIVISKTGEGLDTEYQVMPEPKEPLAGDIKKIVKETQVNLAALYEGEDPFTYEALTEDVNPEDIPL